MSTITCPNCGVGAPEGAAFCDNCGAPLAAPAAPAAPDTGVCPNCKASVGPDDQFCDNCGFALRDTAGAADAGYDEFDQHKRWLEVLPAGDRLPLVEDQERYIIGRLDPASGSFPDVDLVPFGGEEGGVSRRHARISYDDGRFYIEDLNSVNYTFVNRNRIDVGVAHDLRDGDEIRLGRVLLRFRAARRE